MLAEEIKCKAYLEGIEIPFMNLNINESMGRPATATLSIPPVEEGLYLLPKTLVHIFYKINGQYKLIFEGALSGLGFNRSRGNRAISLSFISNDKEWDRSYLEPLSLDVGAFGKGKFMVINSSNSWMGTTPGDTTDTTGEDLKNGIFKSASNDEIRRKFDFTLSNDLGFDSLISKIKSNLERLENGELENLQQILVDDPTSLLQGITENNPYYDMLDKTLKLNSRLYVSHSSNAPELLVKNQLRQLITRRFSRLGRYTPISSILDLFASYFRYDRTTIAAPTKKGDRLYSTFIKPSTDYFIPINANIVFQDQVVNSSYSRDMEREPTRMLFSAPPIQVQPSKRGDYEPFTIYYAIPAAAIKGQKIEDPDNLDKEVVVAMLTDEEKYRGVNAIRDQITDPLFNTSQSTILPKGEGSDGAIAQDDLSKIKDSKETEADTKKNIGRLSREYFDRKFSTRNAQVITKFSPYRLLGFPAIILDEVFPSVYGQLVGITSEINAMGGVSQVLSINKPKLVNKIAEDKGAVSYTKNMLDIIPEFSDTYAPEDFNNNNIGFKLYNDAMGAEKGEDKSLNNFMPAFVDLDDFGPTAVSQELGVGAFEYEKAPPPRKPPPYNTAYVIRHSINRLNRLSLHKVTTQNKINERELISEKDFWTYLGMKGKPNYFKGEEGGYKDINKLTIGTEDGRIKYDGSSNLSGKPFISVRAERVAALGLKTRIATVKSEGNTYGT